MAQKDAGRTRAAYESVLRALALKPDLAEAHVMHGLILRDMARLDDAEAAYRKAIQINPALDTAHAALGNTLLEQGLLDEAIGSMKTALKTLNDPQAYSNLCLAVNYHPAYGPAELLEVHRGWAEKFENPDRTPIAPHTNDRDPHRRLRVGYVSPDFRAHAVSHFVEPILENHDHEHFEIFCYSNWTVTDATSTRLMRHADNWRDIASRPDKIVAELIRADKIDILIDLAGHTANNRLPVFGMKPAPVQISAIGYPCTTGLRAIDYRLTDEHCDPPGESDRYSSEELLRMPDVFWCYLPREGSPPVVELPASVAGKLTFGSVNNLAKITPQVLELWASIARAVPGSKLLLQASTLGSERSNRRVLEKLAEFGLAGDRVELLGWMNFDDYLRTIQRIDVALDPFPFNGGTTSCHILWMGVPLVTLAGESHRARMGVSLLNSIGLPELIAQSPDEYIKIAKELAQDKSRLVQMRRNLRQRMRSSPLTDAARFTANLQAAYRHVWREWCASSK
jgi:predicted O-linked N-acetylglucosamine transferase (SPINDLY family)